MIDNEIPVLRKEDLISILESLFRFSQQPKNAFIRKGDGLYVLDFHEEFEEHINNDYIHPTKEQTDILKDFSLVDDVLNYKNEPIMLRLSSDTGNELEIRADGLYLAPFTDKLDSHINDNVIHITSTERNTWNNSYQNALDDSKKYTDDELARLNFYDFNFVDSLPIDINVIKPRTIYLTKETYPDSEEEYYVFNLYLNDKWIKLNITKETYKLFATRQYVDDTFLKNTDDSIHEHDNKNILDKFSEDSVTNRLLYNDIDILDNMQISDDPNNSIFVGSDGKLYSKDLSSELASIATQARLSKVILLYQDCDESGTYELEESIDDFNFLLISYYLMPEDPTQPPCDAKMEILDTDTLNDLYTRHIDYILEHDYALSTYNSKIRFNENKMQITYYNRVCIFKIIGVR